MKPRFKTLAILVACVGTALCLLLFALQLSPDTESLDYLQEMVADKGWCSISVAGDDCVIQADIAKIENDSLILKRNATTGDDSLVVVSMNSGSPALAKSVSIRFTREPTDMIELSLNQPECGEIKTSGIMCIKFERNWSLRKWYDHLRWKVKNIIK
jgi:hypothetical protein